jgi:hypothetical protein
VIDKKEVAKLIREAVVAAEEFTECLEVLVIALGRSHEEVEESLWAMVWEGYTTDQQWEKCAEEMMQSVCEEGVAVDPFVQHCLDYMRWTYERRLYVED